MKWAGHVTLYSTRARPSWYGFWQSYPLRYWYVTDQTILQLDAGQHPARDGLAALPYFDEFDLSTIDILLISQ